MSEKWIEVASFTTPIEADLARNHLEAEGINVHMEGDAVVGWVWSISNAVGGIKLMVLEEDFIRAENLLIPPAQRPSLPIRETNAGLSEGDDWNCHACGVKNHWSADYCVSCGVFRGGESDTVLDPGDEEEDAPISVTEQIASRAGLCAVLGLFLCPPALHIYSLFLLLQVASAEEKLSSSVKRKVWGALMIDCVVLTIMLPVVVFLGLLR